MRVPGSAGGERSGIGMTPGRCRGGENRVEMSGGARARHLFEIDEAARSCALRALRALRAQQEFPPLWRAQQSP